MLTVPVLLHPSLIFFISKSLKHLTKFLPRPLNAISYEEFLRESIAISQNDHTIVLEVIIELFTHSLSSLFNRQFEVAVDDLFERPDLSYLQFQIGEISGWYDNDLGWGLETLFRTFRLMLNVFSYLFSKDRTIYFPTIPSLDESNGFERTSFPPQETDTP